MPLHGVFGEVFTSAAFLSTLARRALGTGYDAIGRSRRRSVSGIGTSRVVRACNLSCPRDALRTAHPALSVVVSIFPPHPLRVTYVSATSLAYPPSRSPSS